MKRGARAQAAMEYVMIAGLVAMIIIPTTFIFYNYASDSANEIDGAQIDKFGRDVVNTAESVYYLGPPSRIIIEERLPKNIESISIERDSISGNYIFAIAGLAKAGISNVTFLSKVRIEGVFDVEDRAPGIKKVRISAEKDATGQPFVYIRFSDFGRAFVSSATYSGNLLAAAQAISPGFAGDGLQAGDFLCQNLATAASLGGTWKAWLSSPTAAASSRIVDKAYKSTNNTLFANNLADLTDGALANAIHRTESGSYLPLTELTWTGTASDGQPHADTCTGWTGVGFGSAGDPSMQSADWTETIDLIDCAQEYHIYCFEQ